MTIRVTYTIFSIQDAKYKLITVMDMQIDECKYIVIVSQLAPAARRVTEPANVLDTNNRLWTYR